MSKNKKKILISLTIIIFLGILVFKFTEFGNIAKWYLTPFTEKKLNGFAKKKNDYQRIVDKIIILRNKGKEVKKDDYLVVDRDIIYSSIPGKKLELTNEEKESIKNIKKTFTGEFCVMDTIVVYTDNYIKFASSECTFGVIYSENGEKPPSKVEYEDLIIEYKIKSIAPKWYTIEEK